MSTTQTQMADATIESADRLAAESRAALRDLILALADSKRLLGIRYSDWMLAAPTLESGIAAASMAQDEWGHSRLTYALLGDFGDDPKALEHDREAVEYRSPEVLDRGLGSWVDLIAAGLLLDTALAVQYGALSESRYTPVRNRVQKMLDEERFHFQHALGWTRRLAASPGARDEFLAAVRRLLPIALRWFGTPDDAAARQLDEEGIARSAPDRLRQRLLATVGPVLEEVGFADALGITRQNGSWSYTHALDWSGWDARRRRAAGGGPEAETLARVRGDKNRVFLMD